MFKSSEAKKWIHRHIAFKSAEYNLTGFAVIHYAANGAPLELEAVPLPAGEMEVSEYIDHLIELAAESAINACEGMDGVQKFSVQARFDQRDPFNFFFRHSVQAHSGDNVNGSEPANAQGLLQMTMRHLEARERGIWGIVVQQQAQAQAMIARQSEMIDKLQDERYAAITMQQDLLDKKQERDIVTQREARKERVIGEVVEKFMALAPIAVYKLTGKNILGANVADKAAAAEMTDSFIVSLTKEQFDEMTGPKSTLRPEQKALFGALFADYVKREEAKNKRLGKSPGDDSKDL